MDVVKNEIVKDIHERQIQFVYYLIGLNVASIGFTVGQTIDDKLNCMHFLIMISYVMWITSVFLGFRYVTLTIHLLKMDLIEAKTDRKGRSFNGVNSKVVKNYNWLQYLFYTGLISFMVWYIIQMINS